MAEEIPLGRYVLSLLALLLLTHFATSLSAKSVSSFSFKRFDQNPSSESEITLMGDARVVNGGSVVEITSSASWSSGRVMYRRPIRVFDGMKNPREPMSFSTYFSFSISPGNGDGLAFVIFPTSFGRKSFDGRSFGVPSGLDKGGKGVLIVEFDTSMDSELGDPNGNHVGVDLGTLVSARVTNVSEINLVLNSGEKLQSWIDYNASSKRLEVRLCGSTAKRPFDPLISYPINLMQVWKDEEVFVGISSSSGNSSQVSRLYSWSFRLRRVPAWLHSEPLDPSHVYSRETKAPFMQGKSNSSSSSTCPLRILSVLIFGTACGALVFFVLFMWATFANRRHPMVVPMPKEYPVHPVEFGYEKMKPATEKVTTTDDKK
ncbi:hypothetical protein Syun_000394 [Stephania yunnanensis]|uniref:Legume lectin domain-containing protein n=1 Tax=Stephania yunnanensis TaxID=152371 RepID=A0AAP0LFX4_9MAGN